MSSLSSLSPLPPGVDNIELLVSFNNVTKPALSIPASRAATFAINPLKWLRFLGFTIVGQKGYLATSSSGPEIADYNGEIVESSYYFISQGEPHLIDVDAMDDRTSSATSTFSQRAADFRNKLLARDGTCVVTEDSADFCEACHIIPHSKGDDYIMEFCRFRGGVYDFDEPLDGIDDIRNGLLLQVTLHRQLGKKRSAFLKTPNFALTVDDIPYLSANENSPASRCTLHHFVPEGTSAVLSPSAPHNKDARLPQDISAWPPSIILDLCYGAAAVAAWGKSTGFAEYVRMEVGASGTGRGGPTAREKEQREARTARQLAQRAKQEQATEPMGQSSEVDTLDVVLALWKRSAREYQQRSQKSDTPDPTPNQDKVQAWLQSLEPPGT